MSFFSVLTHNEDIEFHRCNIICASEELNSISLFNRSNVTRSLVDIGYGSKILLKIDSVLTLLVRIICLVRFENMMVFIAIGGSMLMVY